MKRQSSSKKSRTNFRRLRSMKGKDIPLTAEHSEADVKHIVRGIVRNQTRINFVLRAFTEAAG